MRGTVLVLDTSYFTTSSTAASDRLRGLPAGNYTLVAWVSERTQYRKKVVLSADSRLTINLPGS